MAILGVWMWPQNVLKYGAEAVIAHCARAGITDVFFLAKGLAGTTAFHSAYAPHVSGRDLLQELTQAAHQRGIRVHAWFTSACDEHYKRLYPESGRCHFTRGKDRELISLADEGYLAYMENIIREVSRAYDIDGLHLDYIRYNHLIYGWAEEDIVRYASHGADPTRLRGLMERAYCLEPREEQCLFDAYRAGDESVLALARARRTDVVRFAERLTQAAKAENPDLILSAALMPEGAYEDIAFSDLHYGQNYEDAAKLFDYALPMAYSQAYGQNADWVRAVAEGTMKRGLRTIAGLHAFEGGTGLTLKRDISALKDTAVEGVCLFREGAFAMARAENRELVLWNALEEELTQVKASCAEETVVLNECIRPGEEKRWMLPFEADTVQVLAGQTEKSVFLTR